MNANVASATKKYGVLGAMFYSRAARLVAPMLISRQIGPNAVTLTGLVLFVGGSCLLLSADKAIAVGGFVLLHFGVVLDYADGIVARATDNCSFFGSWLDNCIDRAADFLVMLLAGIAFVRNQHFGDEAAAVVVGGGVFLMIFVHYMHDIGYFHKSARGEPGATDGGATATAGGVATKLGVLWLMMFNRDTFVLLLTVFLLLKSAWMMFPIVVLVLLINVGLLIVREVRQSYGQNR